MFSRLYFISVWSWTDESPYLFRNWNDGEPSSNSWRDLGEKCVEMKPSGKWNDINCANYERAYFCRGDPGMVVYLLLLLGILF